MRKILIVGGGQAGLQLALGLQHHDYDVTLMTARTAEELRTGRAVSFQGQWPQTRVGEREYGLDFWDDEVPAMYETRYRFPGFGGIPGFSSRGRLPQPVLAVDERIKVPAWQELFEQRGGTVIISPVTSGDLDQLAHMFDLVVVAAGHSGLAEMFPPHAGRTLPDVKPTITVTAYVRGDTLPEPDLGLVDLLPEGFITVLPTLTTGGRGRLCCISGPADGILSSWPARIRPAEHLELMLQTVREATPDLYEHLRDVELVDSRSVAVDHMVPQVRQPVVELPSGGIAMGLGDTVLTTLPQLCQDANNASKSAEIALQHILAHGKAPFDAEFVHTVFADFWDFAHHIAGPVAKIVVEHQPQMMEIFQASEHYPQIADRFLAALGDPADFAEWYTTPEKARAYIASVTGAPVAQS